MAYMYPSLFPYVSDLSASCSLWLCICDTALWPLSNLIVVCLCVPAVQTGGAVHVLPQAASRYEAKNPRLLRAPLPGQDVWRGEHPGRVERASPRGEMSGLASGTYWIVMHLKLCVQLDIPLSSVHVHVGKVVQIQTSKTNKQKKVCVADIFPTVSLISSLSETVRGQYIL